MEGAHSSSFWVELEQVVGMRSRSRISVSVTSKYQLQSYSVLIAFYKQKNLIYLLILLSLIVWF